MIHRLFLSFSIIFWFNGFSNASNFIETSTNVSTSITTQFDLIDRTYVDDLDNFSSSISTNWPRETTKLPIDFITEGKTSICSFRRVFLQRSITEFQISSTTKNFEMLVDVPLFFSIVSLSIVRFPDELFYSVEIRINETCPIQRNETTGKLSFHPVSSGDQRKICSFNEFSSELIVCHSLLYGVHYTIDGDFQCQTQHVSLQPSRKIYQIGQPKYLNSTTSSTSIESLFFMPGMFSRLIVDLTIVNRTCSIEYSRRESPFYRCFFKNLPSAQSFILTYYLPTDDEQTTTMTTTGDATIVHTELEDFIFRCFWNENERNVDFSWKTLTAVGYQNISISIFNEKNHLILTVLCDPYRSENLCSTKYFRFDSAEFYFFVAKLKKISANYHRQKNETCSIKTSLSSISTDSIRHEFVNETFLRLMWSNDRSQIVVRLRNLETNSLIYPIETNFNQTALFFQLAEGNIYRVEFNISKADWTPLIQITNYRFQTDLKTTSIEKIVRLGDQSLVIQTNRSRSTTTKLLFCIEQLSDSTFNYCSSSNRFHQLFSGTIYKITLINYRDPFEKKFFWSNRTTIKFVNTNPSPLRIRALKKNETRQDQCAAELMNTFPISHRSECFSLESSIERRAFCSELHCGCQYEYRLSLNQSIFNSMCSQFDCDFQFDHQNFTRTKFQTPLPTVQNLRLKSSSTIAKKIEVHYDEPSGCFDEIVLICETMSSKFRRSVPYGNVCENLLIDEFYRVYVETRRSGWESSRSNILQTRLLSTAEIILQSNQRHYQLISILVPCLIGAFLILVFSFLAAFLFVYRQRLRKRTNDDDPKHQQKQRTTIQQNNTTITNTELNQIVHQMNVYPNSQKNSSSKLIRIQDLPLLYKKLIQNNYYHLSTEFHELDENLPLTLTYPQCNQTAKNRYRDIRPYEHSRVKLISIDESDSDYINASFIPGLQKPREYIVCQAPLKTTLNDHWQMIWEQNVSIIVMLTDLVERGTKKCERYWPIECDQNEFFGNITVTMIGCIRLAAYDLHCIQLKKNDEIRSLRHYAFKMWKDHTIPNNTVCLVNFIRQIRSEYHPEQDGPILVHCSAGVGRSGTFITLDRLLQQFDQLSFDASLDIYGTVLELRKARGKMVQNEQQYLFIYQCMKEQYEKISGHQNDITVGSRVSL